MAERNDDPCVLDSESDWDWVRFPCDGCQILSPAEMTERAAREAAIDAGWQLGEQDLCPDCREDVGRW